MAARYPSPSAVERIRRSVKQTEAHRRDLRPVRHTDAAPRPGFWAEITGGDAQGYDWKMLQSDGAGGLVDDVDGVTGAATAFSANPDIVANPGARVWLRFAGFTSAGHAAFIFAGAAPAQVVPVNLSTTSGDPGDLEAVCTYIYTVTDLDGATLGSSISPEHQRPPVGAMVAATVGLAYYLPDGTLKLQWTDEVPDVLGCDP